MRPSSVPCQHHNALFVACLDLCMPSSLFLFTNTTAMFLFSFSRPSMAVARSAEVTNVTGVNIGDRIISSESGKPKATRKLPGVPCCGLCDDRKRGLSNVCLRSKPKFPLFLVHGERSSHHRIQGTGHELSSIVALWSCRSPVQSR